LDNSSFLIPSPDSYFHPVQEKKNSPIRLTFQTFLQFDAKMPTRRDIIHLVRVPDQFINQGGNRSAKPKKKGKQYDDVASARRLHIYKNPRPPVESVMNGVAHTFMYKYNSSDRHPGRRPRSSAEAIFTVKTIWRGLKKYTYIYVSLTITEF
jgi:hypothetical protein